MLLGLGGLEAWARLRARGGPEGEEVWRTSQVRVAEIGEIGFESIPCPDCPDPINSRGFRGPEYAPRPEPGTRRLAVLGDSVAYGTHVRADQALPAVLERALNGAAVELAGEESPERFEVVNAATPAYNLTLIEACYRRKVRSYHPEAVLYAFFPNDLDKLRIHQVEGDPPRVLLVRPDHLDPPLWAWIPAPLHGILDRRSYAFHWLSSIAWRRARARGDVPPGEIHERTRRSEVEALERLVREVREDGARFALLLVPPASMPVERVEQCVDLGPRAPAAWCAFSMEMLDVAAGLGSRLGVPVIDARPHLARHADLDLRARPDDPDHPGALGHAVLARAVLEELGTWVEGSGAGPIGERAALLVGVEELRRSLAPFAPPSEGGG